jgi:competence protein ComEC
LLLATAPGPLAFRLHFARSACSCTRAEVRRPREAGEGVRAPLDLRLAIPACAAWAGAWLAVGGSAGRAVIGATLATLLTLWGVSRQGWVLVAAAGLFAATSAAGAITVSSRAAGPSPRLAASRAAVTTDLVLTGDPRATQPKVAAPWAAAHSLVVVPGRGLRLRAEGRDYVLHQQLLVLTDTVAWLGLLPGTTVRAEGRRARGRRLPSCPGSAIACARRRSVRVAGR